MAIVYPDQQETLALEAIIAKKLRKRIEKKNIFSKSASKLGVRSAAAETANWEGMLDALFDSIDDDKNGFLEKHEFVAKMMELELNVTDAALDLVFAALAKTDPDKVGRWLT